MAEAQIANRVTNLKITRDTATERDVVATWTWNNNKYTKGFNIRWRYYSKAGKVSVIDKDELIDSSSRMSR